MNILTSAPTRIPVAAQRRRRARAMAARLPGRPFGTIPDALGPGPSDGPGARG